MAVMQLVYPWALGLLALSGLIVVFHMLRPRYRKARVPSLLLWQRVHEALTLHSRWQRVTATLLFVLHLLLLCMLVLAFSHPLLSTVRRNRFVVHVIDASASMTATDVQPTRFAYAVSQVADHLRRHHGEVVIIQADMVPYVVYRGTDRSAAAAALSDLAPFAGTTDWETVAELLAQLGEEPDDIIVWTDGVTDPHAFDAVRRIAGKRLMMQTIGTTAARNVGISRFAAYEKGALAGSYEMALTVTNFGPQPEHVPVEIETDTGLVFAHELVIPPEDEVDLLLPWTVDESRVLTARLTVDDDFPADNSAFLVVHEPLPTRVAIVGASHRFLEEGLRIFPGVQLERRLLLPENARYDLVIFDRVTPVDGSGNRLVIAPTPADPAVSRPVVTWSHPTHPLTRYIDWTSIGIERAAPLAIDEDTIVLVDSDIGPLLALSTAPEGYEVQLAFSLDDSDFGTRVAFPIFLSQLLQFIHPTGWDTVQSPVASGVPLMLPQPAAEVLKSGGVLRDPDGNPVPVEHGGSSTWVIPRRSGLYTLDAPEAVWHFAVAPPPREEASLRPRINADAGALEMVPESASVLQPLWPWLIAGIVLLLFLEAWLYQHRRRPPFAQSTGRAGSTSKAAGGEIP